MTTTQRLKNSATMAKRHVLMGAVAACRGVGRGVCLVIYCLAPEGMKGAHELRPAPRLLFSVSDTLRGNRSHHGAAEHGSVRLDDLAGLRCVQPKLPRDLVDACWLGQLRFAKAKLTVLLLQQRHLGSLRLNLVAEFNR